MGTRWLASGALLLLSTTAPLAASATIIQDDTIVGTTTHDFEALPVAVRSTVSLPGATYGERFAGQTLSVDVDQATFDVLSGTPTSPLTLLAGAPGFSLAVTPSGSPSFPGTFLAGCGPILPGCPATSSVGEGAVSVLFDEDQQLFGFEVFTEGLGTVDVQFFSRTGASLGAFSIAPAAGIDFVGFRVVDGDWIAGVSLTNDDPQGVGFDSVTFSTIPEPSSASLLLLGLVGLAATVRRVRCRSRSCDP